MSTLNASNGRGTPRSSQPGHRLWVLVIALAALAVAVVGCGGSSAQNTLPAQNAASSQPTAVPSTIRIADDGVVTSLDPIVEPEYEFLELTSLWGGFLTTYGAGKPSLANTLTPSNGSTVWTVNLEPGVKFSDGTPITAKDVVASFERVAKSEGIEGDFFVGPFFRKLSSVTADGDSTVMFKFHEPEPDFAKEVSQPEMVIVPASGIAEGESFWKQPISAGRYVVASADMVNGSFKFTQNPNYPGTAPKVKTVLVTSVPDPATRLAQLKSGQTDYAENLPGNLLPQITDNLRVDPAPWFGGSLYLAPNVHKGSILSDVRIRQAINLAVDRQQVSETALGGEVAGKPLYGIPWNQTNEPPNAAPFPQDIEKAKELLRGTACENGCTLPTTYFTDAVWQLPVVAQVVAQQLKEIGITLKLEGLSIAKESEFEHKGWELALGWTGGYDDSAAFVSGYYVSGGWMPSTTGFSSPRMTALGHEMAIAEPQKLPPMIEQANELFAKNLPIIPLTTLTYLAGSPLPATTLTNTGATYLDLG
jgi:peptide/nickel transport system substrate-binding protein